MVIYTKTFLSLSQRSTGKMLIINYDINVEVSIFQDIRRHDGLSLVAQVMNTCYIEKLA